MADQFNQQLYDEANAAIEASERFAGYLINQDLVENNEAYLEYLRLAKIADTKIRECVAVNKKFLLRKGKMRFQEFPLPGGGVVEYAVKF